MELLLIFSVFLVSANALSQEDTETFLAELQEVGGKCSEEVHASSEDISALIHHELPPSHEGKCMIFCMHKHYNFQKEDGSVDMVGTLKTLGRIKTADPELYGKAMKIMKKCFETVKIASDPCDTAASFFVCGKEEAAKVGLDMEALSG